MHIVIVGLWIVSTVSAVSLMLNPATNHFTYPSSTSTLDYHGGDEVNVSWVSSFTNPWLQVRCDHVPRRKPSDPACLFGQLLADIPEKLSPDIEFQALALTS